MFFGRYGRKVVYINGTAQPVGLARLILKGWQKLFHTKFVPLGGNYAAKLQSRLLGTGKYIIRRRKEQARTDLGSQVWFSRDQEIYLIRPLLCTTSSRILLPNMSSAEFGVAL